MSTLSDISDERYLTEPDIGTSDIGMKEMQSAIMLDMGLNFLPISNIRRIPVNFPHEIL